MFDLKFLIGFGCLLEWNYLFFVLKKVKNDVGLEWNMYRLYRLRLKVKFKFLL